MSILTPGHEEVNGGINIKRIWIDEESGFGTKNRTIRFMSSPTESVFKTEQIRLLCFI
jgi:hypothetical protein